MPVMLKQTDNRQQNANFPFTASKARRHESCNLKVPRSANRPWGRPKVAAAVLFTPHQLLHPPLPVNAESAPTLAANLVLLLFIHILYDGSSLLL